MTDTPSIEPLIRLKSLHEGSVRYFLSKEFSEKYVSQPLHLTYPQEVDLGSLPNSIVDIPLITNVIPVIWFSGKEYSIEEMDEDLYHSLITIKEFFKRFFYNTSWEGELRPKLLVKNKLPKAKPQAAALFTGGLDSTTTVFRHIHENLSLISFNEAHKTAVEFSQIHHLNLYTIQTNCLRFLKLTDLDKATLDITKWFWDTTMGLSWVGSAAPFLYVTGMQHLYIPSGFTWQAFIFPDGQTMRQPASPLIDDNVSPIGLQARHDAFTMTRTDKIKFISTYCKEHNIPKPQLMVCTYHKRSDTTYSNCNKCTKCLITMLDIIAIGEKLHDYGFTLSEQEFIAQFKSYIEKLTMRRGGTYAALFDTQNYIKKHLQTLPATYRTFYDWFIAIDLWSRVEKIDEGASDRPLRTIPFDWKDYEDLYPELAKLNL